LLQKMKTRWDGGQQLGVFAFRLQSFEKQLSC
jgi:hypothetical protein